MNYSEVILQELIPAFGCTEPIALAYCAAKAAQLLGEEVEEIGARVSGNIIKNAYSVKVPGTEGRKGLEISIVAGALLGDADKKLEVLSAIDKTQLARCDQFIKAGHVQVELQDGVDNLYINITVRGRGHEAEVKIFGSHTNIIYMRCDEEVLLEKDMACSRAKQVDFSFEDIFNYAQNADYSPLKKLLDLEIKYNMEIAAEGLQRPWGSQIGQLVLKHACGNSSEKYVAYAAAGSDARMSGCERPVVINSGSGNQGITVSVPIILYAKDHAFSDEALYRALIFANLLALYLKQGIGKLSAYCGVVSAASASVCGIGFLNHEPVEILADTLSNALAVNSGLICDGAKPSCAMKIASSLRNAFLAYEQAKCDVSFEPGDGIVRPNVDETIGTVGRIARDGMKQTDVVILKEMLKG
ncbi:MAG: L-serine ammonia-lyase, iron-sulfur-dependent, subunit alpha [Eubacteriales bacterium]|nr:L-serine ammonia-lyase, iron-sulfur-dependent, subunit alpha [Eubacteriales bacterium]